MQQIWAPWRIKYIQMKKTRSCIFCDKPKQDKDTENYILYRADKNFVILNCFPYNPGHLMVVPYRHIARLEDMSDEERNEHYAIVNQFLPILRRVFNPEGFNIGMNLSRVAGAGIDDHIHTHIVPRWKGDTNFMPVLADTKILPESLAETYKKLKENL